MAHAKKTDANQDEIVKLFRQLGCLVFITSGLGKGFPDLIVQRRHPHSGFVNTWLVEVKDGTRPPSERRLTALQSIFHKIWHCHIVECEQDVYDLLKVNVI